MINSIYTPLTFALATVLFVLALLFYCLCSSMKSPVFRTALRIMTFTYCFFGLVNVLEVWSRTTLPDSEDVLLFQIATLIVAMSQAFLFTYTLVLLIHSAYVTRKRVVRELIPILTLSVSLVTAYFILPDAGVKIAIQLFILFYIWLLIKYVRLFITTYRDCLRKLDNFFSGQEAEHLRWVNFSFYAALSVGVMALIISLFPSIRMGVVCSVTCLLFYPYFAIRIIKYGFVYKKLAVALADDTPQSEQSEEEESAPQPLIAKSFENNLKIWLDKKQFLYADVTINDLALQIGTNRSYLSEYINTAKGKTFRQWINELRIDHAKHLLDKNPELELYKIAEQTGYPDNKYFSTCFKKITGKTPTEYRGK